MVDDLASLYLRSVAGILERFGCIPRVFLILIFLLIEYRGSMHLTIVLLDAVTGCLFIFFGRAAYVYYV